MGRRRRTNPPQLTASTLSDLGAIVRVTRESRGLTAVALAERAGCSRATVSAIEQGNPRVAIGIVVNVMLALGIQARALPVLGA